MIRRQQRTAAGPALPTVDTSIWGPPLWRVLHTLCELRPDAEWGSVVAALRESLPCPDCRKHFADWVRRMPLRPGDARGWFLALHNDVNRRNRVGRVWTAAEVSGAYGLVDLSGNVMDGAVRSAEVREALTGLQGVLGAPGWNALTGLLG